MKKLYILTLFIALALCSKAQLQVETNISDETLQDWIEGTDVLVSNLVIECDSSSYGTYINPSFDNGLESFEGILFTSGSAVLAVGPNNSGGATGSNNQYQGDMDLEMSLPGYPMYDVCRVEFDVIPLYEYMLFDYVWGSEEYLEFVNSSFNDVFGFFVSGPGIDGDFTNGAANYSVVPGTNLPVAIDNVNDMINSEYYVNNGDGWEEPFSSDSTYCQYDGLTTNMPGVISTVPNETYHVKIVVADAGDSALDSGVFLQKESFMSVPSIVGIQEFNSLNLSLFPNPTTDYLKLEGDDLSKVTAYQVFNIEGKKIMEGSVNGNSNIDVRELEVGNYVLNLYAGSRVMSSMNWMKN